MLASHLISPFSPLPHRDIPNSQNDHTHSHAYVNLDFRSHTSTPISIHGMNIFIVLGDTKSLDALELAYRNTEGQKKKHA